MTVLLAGFVGQLLTKLSDPFRVFASEVKQSGAKHRPELSRGILRFTQDFCARKIIAHYF
jgi:hypothetical protein